MHNLFLFLLLYHQKVIRKDAKYQGPLQVAHSLVTPTKSVFVCHLGAATVAAAPAAGAAVAPAAGGAAAKDDKKKDDKKKEEKKEEKKKEPEPEEDAGMDGFSLFD